MKKDNTKEQDENVQATGNKDEQLEVESQKPEVQTEKKNEVDFEQKYKELNESHLRLMAEFDNYRKRTMREKADIIKNAGEHIILEFLPIVDNFERALANMEKTNDVESIKEGVKLIYQQILKMLDQNGVKVIETEKEPFDTEYHEALTTIPAPSEDMKNKIIDCTTKGYTMNDKVIRHAKVVVGQ